MEEFKVGDVVRLKSGGPAMTVGWIRFAYGGDSCNAVCHWFVDGKHYQGEFDIAILEHTASTIPEQPPKKVKKTFWLPVFKKEGEDSYYPGLIFVEQGYKESRNIRFVGTYPIEVEVEEE